MTVPSPALSQTEERAPPPTQALIDKLLGQLSAYLPKRDVKKVGKACDFSVKAHHGQSRASGEPYVHHPIQVALLMAELHLDAEAITAGILHDVIEDTPLTRESLKTKFGAPVADIVDGVSKIDRLERHCSPKEAQASSLQKMILALTRDMRVILVKLADRLHNIRTLGSLSSERRRRIARETLEVYAAIAHRLGMDRIRRELQNRSFEYLYPMRARVIGATLDALVKRCDPTLGHMHQAIHEALAAAGIEYSFEVRNKSAYSVYCKMVQKRVPFSVVTDVFGFRIVVPSVDDCYRTMGILHNLYKPVPGKFKDYIALPKSNGYQSLHTVLFGPHHLYAEAQIRTRDMDAVADHGIASHHLYKIGEPIDSAALVKAREWVASLTALNEQTEDSESFVAGVKLNLFPNEIYVFTPQGRICELPRDATVLDFAFAVHTDIGLACRAARVDNRLCAISTKLKTGQTVEILTSPKAKPDPSWLGFLITARARAAVQHRLKRMRKEDAEKLGRRLLTQALKKRNARLGDVGASQRRRLFKHRGFKTMRDVCRAVGTGEHAAHIVAAQLLDKDVLSHRHMQTVSLGDPGGLAISYGHCCYPIPGDQAVGLLRPGHGFTVHRRRCANITAGHRRNMEIFPVQWPDNAENEYRVAIRVEARHERGVLATIAGKIAAAGSNIEHVHFEGEGGPIARLLFILSVTDRSQLNKVIRRIRTSFKEVKVVRVGQSSQQQTPDQPGEDHEESYFDAQGAAGHRGLFAGD